MIGGFWSTLSVSVFCGQLVVAVIIIGVEVQRTSVQCMLLKVDAVIFQFSTVSVIADFTIKSMAPDFHSEIHRANM